VAASIAGSATFDASPARGRQPLDDLVIEGFNPYGPATTPAAT
jgi:hypothetical protein